MGNPVPLPGAPAAIGWDMAFTRLSNAVQERVKALLQDLTSRLHAAGLGCDVQVRQTPRGVSTLLAVVGQRGLIFIVDITLVDGMSVGRQPGARLDLRLLDACGDVAATCSACSCDDASALQTSPDRILAWTQVGLCSTAIYVLAMGHFGLVAPAPNCA
jgi:hypothetical protein